MQLPELLTSLSITYNINYVILTQLFKNLEALPSFEQDIEREEL